MQYSVTTPGEVMRAIESGCRVFCKWKQAIRFTVFPSEVIQVAGNRILVRHWEDRWHSIGDPSFDLIAYPPMPKPAFRDWLSDQGAESPNLGVNRESGNAVGVAGELSELWRRYKGE